MTVSNVSSASSTLSAKITAGALSSALTSDSHALIKWTATYKFNSKTFTSFNSSASSSNNILKSTNFKKEISVMSPTASSSKRKHFYLSDIMQTKYKYGALNTLIKDKKAMPLSRKELIKKKDLENYNAFISGFKLN